jgi:phage tail-like protein
MLKFAVLAVALAMVAATSAAARHDPYKSYRFVLYKDGRAVAGATRQTPLTSSHEVVKHRAGGDPGSSRRSPGRNKFEPITLERGVTQDTGFANWAQSSASPHASLVLKEFNSQGKLKRTRRLSGCWSSEYRALPRLNNKGHAIAIEHLKLQCGP